MTASGLTTLTRIPSGAPSSARQRAKWISAALADVLAVAPRQVGHRVLQGAGVHVRQRDAGALRQEPQRSGTADATSAAGDEGDAAGQAPGLRHALQLGLLEQPVLDVERLL